MPFAVFVTTPRAGLGFAVAPYTVEMAQQFETREAADAYVATKPLPAGVLARFDAMPPLHPAWQAGDVFKIGDYRSWNGKAWRCIQGHTAITGWEPANVPALWALAETPGLTAWQAGVSYTLPSERTYQGRLYRLLQAHTSQAAWNPPAVPALWQDIGDAQAVPAYSRAAWEVIDTTSAEYVERERATEA
jgi:hypothetical protein